MVAGHECAGVVEDIGRGRHPGQGRATMWPAPGCVPCGDCPECRAGLGNVCSGNFPHFVGGTMLDGTTRIRDAKGNPVLHGNFVSGFSDYTVVPEDGARPVRKDIPLD